MNKEKSITICPICHRIDKVIRYGKRNNIQRYRCNRCNCVFQEKKKRVKLSANEKTLLALLVSLINSEKGNLAKSAIKNVYNILNEIEDYRLVEKQCKNDKVIFCKNPCLLVCDKGDGDIIVYRIPKKESLTKEIKIIDDSYN